MLMSTANQAYVFLSTVYTGMVLGLIYDLNRMIRRIFKPRRWIVGALDLLFWLIAAIIVFVVLFFANNGEIGCTTVLDWRLDGACISSP